MLTPTFRRARELAQARAPGLQSLATLGVVVVAAAASGCVGSLALPQGERLRAALDRTPTGHESVEPATRERISTPAFDASDGLDVQESALAALELNPLLVAARAARGVAHAQLTQAGILPNPQAVGSFDIPTDGPVAGTSIPYGIEIDWSITPLLSLGTAIEAQERNLESVELDIAWQEWQVAQGARLSALRVLMIERRRAISGRVESALRVQAHTLRSTMVAGDATALEVSAAESALQAASLASLQLTQLARVARVEWQTALGVAPTSDTHVAAGAAPPSWPARFDLEALIEDLPTTRLDLVAMSRAFESHDARARAAAIRQFPAITIGVRRSADTSQLGTVGFVIAVDLPFFDRNQGQVELETATREQVRREYLARVQSARYEVATAHANLLSVREQIALLAQFIPILEGLVTTAETAVGAGSVTVLDLLDVRLRLLYAQLALGELQQNELEIAVALELASGRLLSGGPR